MEEMATSEAASVAKPSLGDGSWKSVATAPSDSKKMEDSEPSMPDNPNMEMNMELVSFKVNENGEFKRVIFTHDESCKEPKHTKKKSAGARQG